MRTGLCIIIAFPVGKIIEYLFTQRTKKFILVKCKVMKLVIGGIKV